jgi:hypothetical protein
VPFTPAHPAAILPFVRWRRALRLDATCLVCGSIAPDFEYFVRGRLAGGFAHGLVGAAVACVPAAILLALVWRWRVQWLYLRVAPVWLARRLEPSAREPAPFAILPAIASAAIGALSHVAWDSFTNAGGWLVHRFPRELKLQVTLPLEGTTALHKIFQHASTGLGLGVVAFVTIRAIARAPAGQADDRPRWPARVVLASASVLAIAALVAWQREAGIAELGNLVVAAISGTLVGSVVATLALALIDRRRGAR